MYFASKMFPIKKINGKYYQRLRTYASVEEAKKHQKTGQKRVKTTLYAPLE